MQHLVDIGVAALLVFVVGTAILRPEQIIRWARRAHPSLSDADETTLSIARGIGLGGLVILLFIAVLILRSLFL